jgi:Tol biopolymer transport system component
LEPSAIPSIKQLRELVAKPQLTAVLLFKLHADSSNYALPVWSDDGKRLAFQRTGTAGAKTSQILLFNQLSQAEPTQLTESPEDYDYMFRWGVNSNTAYTFARISRARGATGVFVSTLGDAPVEKTPAGGRYVAPSLYERTDGIWRLIYEHDGELFQLAWNEKETLEANLSLGRGATARWNFDGSRLALLRERGSSGRVTDWDIAVRTLRTGAESVLSDASSPRVRSPSWSPDGKKIAFFSRPANDSQACRIGVASAAADGPVRLLGQQVIVNLDFDSEGPSWEPSGRRIWYFSHASRQQAYYPLNAVDVNTGETISVDYASRYTTPNDLAMNPTAEIPEVAFVAHDKLNQDLLILLLNHF